MIFNGHAGQEPRNIGGTYHIFQAYGSGSSQGRSEYPAIHMASEKWYGHVPTHWIGSWNSLAHDLPGKRLQKTMRITMFDGKTHIIIENHHVYWENSLFRLGHLQVRNLWNYQRVWPFRALKQSTMMWKNRGKRTSKWKKMEKCMEKYMEGHRLNGTFMEFNVSENGRCLACFMTSVSLWHPWWASGWNRLSLYRLSISYPWLSYLQALENHPTKWAMLTHSSNHGSRRYPTGVHQDIRHVILAEKMKIN